MITQYVKPLIVISVLLMSNILGVITVEFDNQRQKATDACSKIMEKYQNPHIISWFVGYYGLPVSAAQFYKSEILQPLRLGKDHIKCSLIDLSAWRILVEHEQKNPKFSDLFIKHCSSDQINGKNDSIFRVASASKYFEFLFNPDEQSAHHIDFILTHRSRNFILGQSLAYLQKKKERNIPSKLSFKELGAPQSPHLKSIEDIDTDGIFSALQYMEGLYMVKNIVESGNNTRDIIFLLPNEEYKYYYDSHNAFQEDLNAIVKTNSDISVHFVRFDYGKMKTDSPCKILKDGKDHYLPDEEVVKLFD